MMPDRGCTPGAPRHIRASRTRGVGVSDLTADVPSAVPPGRSPPPYRDPPWPWPMSRFRRAGRAWAAAASVPSSPGRLRAPRRHPPGLGIRWHRKHAGRPPGGSTWWAPGAMDWWIGVLFAVGSVCFALGSFPPYATALGTTPDNITFFIGSIFFTTASFLQYAEVAYGAHHPRRGAAGRAPLTAADPARPDRLVGRRHPVARHPLVQPDHLSALLVGLGGAEPPPDLAPRRVGLHLLPRLQLVGLGRGVSRALAWRPSASRGGSPP